MLGNLGRILSEKYQVYVKTLRAVPSTKPRVLRKDGTPKNTFGKKKWRWLVGVLLLSVAVGILIGAIAAGRLRFLFP